MIEKIDTYLANGWKISKETNIKYYLKKDGTTTGGHILFLIFLPILGNIIYHYVSIKKLTIKK